MSFDLPLSLEYVNLWNYSFRLTYGLVSCSIVHHFHCFNWKYVYVFNLPLHVAHFIHIICYLLSPVDLRFFWKMAFSNGKNKPTSVLEQWNSELNVLYPNRPIASGFHLLRGAASIKNMCADCLSTSLPLPVKICHLIGAFFGTTGSHVHGIPCAWESGQKRKAVAKLKPMAYVKPRIFWATKSLLKWVRPSEVVGCLLLLILTPPTDRGWHLALFCFCFCFFLLAFIF